MTKQELIAKLIKTRSRTTVLNWGAFASAISTSGPDTKAAILNAMAKSDWPALGSIISETVRAKQTEQATAEVNQMIAGDKINLNDLIGLVD